MRNEQKSINTIDIPGLDDTIENLKIYASIDSSIPIDKCFTYLNFQDGVYYGERLVNLDFSLSIKQQGKLSLERKVTFGDFVSGFNFQKSEEDMVGSLQTILKKELKNQPIQKMILETQLLLPSTNNSKHIVGGKGVLYFEDNEFGAQVRLGDLRDDYFEYFVPSNSTRFLQKLQDSWFDLNHLYFVPGLCRLKSYSEELQKIGEGLVKKEEIRYKIFPLYYNFLTKIQKDFSPEKTTVLFRGNELSYSGIILNDLSIYLRLRRLHHNFPGELENAEQALEHVLNADEVVDVSGIKKRVSRNNFELEMNPQTYNFLTSPKGKEIIEQLRVKFNQQESMLNQLYEKITHSYPAV